MRAYDDREHFETVIVGAGQAGLATGYHLAAQGLDFVIVDVRRVGDAWRQRWDSLRLFTPAALDGLPGMRFPAPPDAYPAKDEMADYLEAYAMRFGLPLRLGTSVHRVSRNGDGYALGMDAGMITADNVVVATGAFQRPRVPAFASALDPRIVQLHSAQYRRPEQLRDGPVLVVGAGNSGAEIAMDVAARHETWLSGRDTGQIPRVFTRPGLPARLFQWVATSVLTIDRSIGRAYRRRALSRGTPLIRPRRQDLEAAGIRRVPRTAGVRDGRPVLEDGRVLDVANVVWCTGFRPDFGWIDVPVFGTDGYPVHYRGVVDAAPGLYFMGLPFLSSLASSSVGGVGRDAEYIVRHVAARRRPQRARASGSAPEPALTGERG
ncbi:MAG TPA: NAD(P)-binding domain-containing protein [Candidatus Tectomicrobia bacterium]|nr:NAD(P)-binding domain-containing protein [Candidatus Tectomicrobia bacterium]